jgi:hypothetical protein
MSFVLSVNCTSHSFPTVAVDSCELAVLYVEQRSALVSEVLFVYFVILTLLFLWRSKINPLLHLT